MTAHDNLRHDKDSALIRDTRDAACESAFARGLKAPAITAQLIAHQVESTRAGQPRVYFVDPSNRESCYRQVQASIKRAKKKIAATYSAQVGHAEGDILATLNVIIASGLAAWDSPTTHPLKAAAGLRSAIDALKMKARLLRADVDNRALTLPEDDEVSPARVAVQAVAAAARLLRDELNDRGLRLPPSQQVITIGKTNGNGSQTN